MKENRSALFRGFAAIMLFYFVATNIRSIFSRVQVSAFTQQYKYTGFRKYSPHQRSLSSSPAHNLAVPTRSSTDLIDVLDACWSSTTWTINPEGDPRVDQALGGLLSPAPQAFFALQRALREATCVEVAMNSCHFLVKYGFVFVVRRNLDSNDKRFRVGGDWHILSENIPIDENEWRVISRPESIQNALQIAKEALSYLEESSQRQESVDESKVKSTVDKLRCHLNLTLGTDIRGRTCADTAFNLALAGVTDDGLFKVLSKITLLELHRVGKRPSRRGKDILQIVEKLAASGERGGDAEKAFKFAAECVLEKGPKLEPGNDDLLRENGFSLLSARPRVWLWRYSTSLAKPTATSKMDKPLVTLSADVWWRRFENPTKPLVIDIGCGFGVSLLGLASCEKSVDPSPLLSGTDFPDCNFIGGDLNQGATSFANGIAHRWGISKRLSFVTCSTKTLLKQVLESYEGPIALILVQFPTPYRLVHEDYGNSQLPSGVESGFMIDSSVMDQIATILQKSSVGNLKARLLFKTNCEDVALTVRNLANAKGLRCIQTDRCRTIQQLDGMRPSQRTQKWIEMGGDRAAGKDWWHSSLLPVNCDTETEVACNLQNTAVHQCLFETS
ncbi:hypothetical protein FisN_1Lh558 [Fistulifera solaris]|uniref:tRNA (guanine(46)-N(7))-methyltransferase n=1 Tax=Fistulifera solaris TaxID=1519565 RepID=A0A1Z5K1R8_FISSO|nr:hypothetical protein FisN_1Lh558 [Fistulifera solaris]|eukprot:GAX19968.1 hypothetical protein FisN_1Lh558 [Fistulifera solaris]